jgi:hypothetical protein
MEHRVRFESCFNDPPVGCFTKQLGCSREHIVKQAVEAARKPAPAAPQAQSECKSLAAVQQGVQRASCHGQPDSVAAAVS